MDNPTNSISGESNIAFSVSGKLTDNNALIVKQQKLVAYDVDLRGAAVYRRIPTIGEVTANGGFEFLGETLSDNKGSYSITFYSYQFAKNERGKADIIVYAVNDAGEIIGRSKLVNSEDYSDRGEVQNLDISIIQDLEEKTAYELLMGALLPFLAENDVQLIDLVQSADQVQFTASELEETVTKIPLAVDAAVLQASVASADPVDGTGAEVPPQDTGDHKNDTGDIQISEETPVQKGKTVNKQPIKEINNPDDKTDVEPTFEEAVTPEIETGTGTKGTPVSGGDVILNPTVLSHELLYGIGSQNIILSWPGLYQKTDNELKAAIEQSTAGKIIKQFSEQEITEFLQQVHVSAVANAFQPVAKSKGVVSAPPMLIALPEKEQQLSYLNAYHDFRNLQASDETLDNEKFYSEYLLGVKEFQDKPELISGLLFTQKLSTLSGNYQPLMVALQQDPEISSVKQLIALDDAQWKEIITKTGVPESVQGATEEEKVTAYSKQMQASLYAAYPTQKIALMLDKKELPIQDENVATGIQNFLDSNETFDFSKSKISAFEEQIKMAAPDHFESVQTELKRMQDVYQVSPSPETMGVLMEKNLNSAYIIASIPKKSFMQMHSDKLGGEVLAKAVYHRAKHISTQAQERTL